jgi:hypothetical protein
MDAFDILQAMIDAAPEESAPVSCPGFPCEGQLWHSKTSARRGRVEWVSQGKVRLTFDDGTAGVTHCTLDFLRLYSQVK